jgi:phage baseplate assembly protein W
MDGRDRLVSDERLDIVGRGWAFPVGIDLRGKVALTTGTESVERSIKLILLTVRGARVMRPEFGSDIHELVFAENNATTAGLADYHVRRALARWEPRIDVDEVKVTWPDAERGAMLIHLIYRIKATNDRRNLVFPFYAIPEVE